MDVASYMIMYMAKYSMDVASYMIMYGVRILTTRTTLISKKR